MAERSAWDLLQEFILELEETLKPSVQSAQIPVVDKAPPLPLPVPASKEKKIKAVVAEKAPEKVPTAEELSIDALELRVGVITSCVKHETADKLYCETIDVGEAEPRPIASGLVAHYTLDEMIGSRVIVVCNLSPRKLVGFKSHGMVLCAVHADESTGTEIVEFLEPPADAKPGDRISGEGFFGEPLSVKQCDKQDAWKKLAPGFSVQGSIGYWSTFKLVDAQGRECTSKRVTVGLLR